MTNKNQKFSIISPEMKLKANIMPFCTFPLTKKCNFRCIYCGYGGELSASKADAHEYKRLEEKIFAAHRLGVRKFRFTGGEPFLYPHLGELISLFNDLGCYLLINTNGSLVEHYKHYLNNIQKNVVFAVSCDTLIPEKFDLISGTKGNFKKTIKAISILKNSGNLLRLNMVVNKENLDEIHSIIDYCSELGCNLKLLDVVSVPLPYGKRSDLHVSLKKIEKELFGLAEVVKDHLYARSFGTPCKVFRYKGVEVTVKSTWNGSRYDTKGICKGCPYFPCHEGLYDIFCLPDNRVVGCRWSEESISPDTEFTGQLQYIANIYQRAVWVPREKNAAMKPGPRFVINSLKSAGEHIPEFCHDEGKGE